MKTSEKILVVILIVLMVVPSIQKIKPFISFKKLEGDFVVTQKPAFTLQDWWTGEFQSKFDKYTEENIGFRNFLVRLVNQIDFSLFRATHAEGVVVGKNDCLFEYDYIRQINGTDYAGEDIIDVKIRKLKFLQQYLKQEKNIDLVLIFEPGKTTYYSRDIPAKYMTDENPQTNYKLLVQKAKNISLRYIDLNDWFKKLIDKTEYPLFPKYGIHWSTYGMSIVADSLLRYIENLRQIDLPDVYIDSLIVTSTPEKADYDIASTLNLLCHLPNSENLAYPVYRFSENQDKIRPNILAIADSYYWNIYNTGIPENVFKDHSFWYFYSKVYPDSYATETFTQNLNLKEEIEKRDVILLMVTERFLHKLGWGFIEDAYAIYAPLSRFDTLHNLKCDILNYYVWFNTEIERARIRKISLAEDIRLNAEYMYGQNDLNGLLMLAGASYFESQIRNDPKWLKLVKKKAHEQGIVVHEMIRQDAEYMFQTYHNDIRTEYLRLQEIKDSILQDSVLYSKTTLLSGKYYLTLEEAVQIQAERLFDNKEPL